MYESVHETCSQTNSISLHVIPVKPRHEQQLSNQIDKVIDLILSSDTIQILTSFQSMDIKICCTRQDQDQDQGQDSLLVKHRNDNHSPGSVIRELVLSSHQRSELSNTILCIFSR